MLKKITTIGLLAILFFANCDLFNNDDKEKKERQRNLAILGIAALSNQSKGRDPGVYVSGQVVGSDGKTAISNVTITIEGRGETSAIARTGVTASTPTGFYQNVLSTGTNPVTLYGSSATGAPSISSRDSECGSTIVSMYTARTTNRVICDSSALDSSAKSAGISDSLITSGTNVGTITVGADGTFSGIRLPNIATGNTYTIKVSDKTKTRRLRIAKSGTSTLLSGSDDLFLGTSTTDTNTATSASTAEGAGSSSNPYDFNIINLQVELVYSKPFDILTGTLSSNTTLLSSKDYLLSGTVIVPSGITLTIPAGTRIYGAVSPAGALLIKQGGKIDAQGTSTNPIVFSSEKTTGNRSGGDWQGIIIQGNGIQTFGGSGTTAIGEGDVGTFGGNSNSDNSGIMKYVRIEFAGAPFSPGNERNCLSLMGIGSATTLEYIQCHRGYDDGFELWGGAVNGKYWVASGNRDDQFDYADGWIGRLQFGIAQLYATPTAANDDTSRCIEGDGNTSQSCTSSAECSNPSIANITCVGFTSGQNHGDAIFVRRSSNLKAGTFSHFHIVNFGTLRSSNCATATATEINHTYVNGTTGTNSSCTTGAGGNIDQAGTTLTTVSESSPNYAPAASNTVTGSTNVNTIITSADSATYYGAIQFGGTDWTTGWTSYPAN